VLGNVLGGDRQSVGPDAEVLLEDVEQVRAVALRLQALEQEPSDALHLAQDRA
jgi:hypothetical protein